MSGKPAARITDSVSGGKIVTGSRTVLIGSQGGIACSECPGGVTVGSPVSPALGAKVLMGASELDFALPGALPVLWQRRYSSYVNPEHGARCSLLGYGWSLPFEMRIELRSDACLLFVAMGRVITFEALPEGAMLYSPSEDIWLLRGGSKPHWIEEARFQGVPPALSGDSGCILVGSGKGRTLGVLRASGGTSDEPFTMQAEQQSVVFKGVDYVLKGMLDEFGRYQRYEHDEHGHVTSIVDGIGRRYQLILQQLNAARAAQGLWQEDRGWRLVGVDLMEDPSAATQQPVALVRYGYSSAGDLVTVHDRAGRLVREFAWAGHLLVGHRYLQGPRHEYRYESLEPGARVVAHSSEAGLAYRFEYSRTSKGNATRVVDSLERVDTYRFEGDGGLSRLVEHVRPDGSKVGYAYDAAGRLVELNDPLGRTTRFRYDGEGRLLGSQGPDGSQSTQVYDPLGFMLSTTDAAGRSTRFAYDSLGRLTKIQQADGSTEHYEYPAPEEAPFQCEHPVRIIDAKGGVKLLDWSVAGQLVRYTDCSGSAREMQYDRWGQLTRTTNALGQSEHREYDSAGHLVAIHFPDDRSTHYRRDAAGRVVEVLPPGGDKASGIGFSYDLWGRVTQRRYGGFKLDFAYDPAGRATRLTNENGAHTHFGWDVMNRRIREEGVDGRVQTYRYDAAGQLIEVTDGSARNGLSTRYVWDAAGRLAETHVPGTESSAARVERLDHDPAGLVIAARSFLLGTDGQVEQLHTEALIRRDILGRSVGETQRLYKIFPWSQAQTERPHVEFEHVISHELDALGNRLRTDLKELGQVDYLMYGSGHLHGLLYNSRSVLDIERDALHREIKRYSSSRSNPSGGAATEAYRTERQWDRVGRLAQVTTNGLVVGESALGDAASASLVEQVCDCRYLYDVLGQLVRVQTPSGDRHYSYDPAGRLTGARDGASEVQWRFDPAGNRLPWQQDSRLDPSRPGDIDDWAAQVLDQWQAKDFDVLGQNREISQGGPSSAPFDCWRGNRIGYSDDTIYFYDSRGNRVRSVRRDGQVLAMLYDGANQLIEVRALQAPGPRSGPMLTRQAEETVCRFVYDAFGRRLEKAARGGNDDQEVRTFCGWDGDRLVHIERWNPDQERQVTHTVYEPQSFTPLLQLSRKGDGHPEGMAALIAHAKEPQMQKSLHEAVRSLPEAMRQEMEFQAREFLQREVASPMHRTSDEFGVDDSAKGDPERLRNLGLASLAGNEKAHGDIRAGQPITICHFHCDHLGSPRMLTDEEGRIIWAALLDPWGNVQHEYNPTGVEQALRLPGQYRDSETGLHYNRYRYYDPAVGTYVNQDPIGLSGGVNKSLYAYQRPLGSIDPLGLDTYIVNRDLQLFGDSARSRWNPVTHTFTVTTNPDGSIAHTYSWGNEANLNGWNVDQPLDIKTAREALANGSAEKVGDANFDPYVDAAHKNLDKKENEHKNGIVYYNCKTETTKLMNEAKRLQTNATTIPVPNIDINKLFQSFPR